MSFIQRELDAIRTFLLKTPSKDLAYREAYAAQQALEWAMEPTGIRSPFNMITNVPVEKGSGLPS